jgi:hypothetical protein
MSASNSQRSVRQRTEEGLETTRARVETRLVIIQRNVVKADVMIPPFDFIDRLIRENHWDYLYHYSGIVYPWPVQNFYGYLKVVQDEQSGLTLQTTVMAELMLHSLGLLSGLIQFHLRASLSQIPWIPLPHKNCSFF